MTHTATHPARNAATRQVTAAGEQRTGGPRTTFAGTRRLVRLALRQDRVVLTVWVAAVSGLAWAVVASYQGTVITAADRVAAATLSAGSPLTRVFDGPASGTGLGALALVEGWKVLAVLTALMAAQTVVRHTRRDEEVGRAELLGSAVVGRHARLAAALLVAAGASVATGLATTVAIAAPSGLGWSGAAAAGMAAAGMGLVFAGVAAVSSQVFSSARAANGAASATLAVAFVLRAVGDLTGEVTDDGVVLRSAWPSWLSPYGWGQQVRPYLEDNWWIGGLFLGLAAVFVAVAFALADRRDIGPGMVPPRAGPARGGTALRTAFGLAWRLQRGVMAVWLVGLLGFAAAFGSIGDTVADYVEANETMRQMFLALVPDGDVTDVYAVFVMALLGLAVGGYVVQALLRMRAEEVSGRAEPLLATATGRARWLASHVAIAVVGVLAMVLAAGVAAGLGFAAASGDWAGGVSGLVVAAAVQAPAALALGGFVLLAFGALPRWSGPITWFALAAAMVMSQLGALFELPGWLLDVSPFSHVPQVPAEPFALGPVLALTAVAVALGGLGFAAFRRRDLAIGA